MQRLVIDSSLQSLLANPGCELELIDGSGNVVGFFLPIVPSTSRAYDWLRTTVSDAQLEVRSQEAGGKTTAEVLRGITGQ